MSLTSLIQNGVSIADTLTSSLQATVTHKPYSSNDKFNKPTYGTNVSRKCIVDRNQKWLRTAQGEEKLSLAKLTFPYPVTVDERDKFTLPDSTEMPILHVKGIVDPTTNAEYAVEVFLG